MPFDDGDLREVAVRIGDDGLAAPGRLLRQLTGDDGPRVDADHADPSVRAHGEILPADRMDPHAVPERIRRTHARDLDGHAALGDEPAALPDALGPEPLEIVHRDDVREVAGSQRAVLGQAVVPRGVDRRHRDRVGGRTAEPHRLADDVVDVPFIDEVVRLAIIRAQQTVGGSEPQHER